MPITYLLPPIAAIFTVYSIISFTIANRDLNDANARVFYIQRLTTPWYAKNYKGALNYILTWLDKIFRDPKPFSRSSYLLCSVISFVYSLFGFLIAWSFGGPGKIGTTVLLPESWPLEDRGRFTALLVMVCILLYVFTAYPLTILLQIRKGLTRFVEISSSTGTALALSTLLVEFILFYTYTHDPVLLTLLIISSAVLGVWLSSMAMVGGAIVGWLAAMFSAFSSNGSPRMLAAIAILAAIALGGSRGARPVATLLTRRYHEISKRYGGLFPSTRIVKTLGKSFPTLIFALVGATGGAAFVAAASRTYAYLVGAEVDVLLLESLGFSSSSPALPLAGAIAGLIGGALASRLGASAVILSSIVSALLLCVLLSTRVLSHYKLPDYFGASSFVGAAMINILLFFVILPPINAFWDWLAWGLSRWLGRRIMPTINLGTIIFQTLSSIFFSFVLLAGLTASATEAITLFNKWMFIHTNTIPLPLEAIAKATSENPFSAEGIWITVMLFSTFLPTLCHLTFILFGVLLVVHTPKTWRLAMAQRLIATKSSVDLIFPVLYFTYVPLIGALAVGFIAWLSFAAFSMLGTSVSQRLYALVHWLIT